MTQTLKPLPRLVAALSLLLVAALQATAVQPSRIYHDEIAHACRDTMIVLATAADYDDDILATAIEVRGTCAPAGSRQADRTSAYGLAWGIDSAGNHYRVMLSPGETDSYDQLVDSRHVCLVVQQINADGSIARTLESRNLTDGVDIQRCENSLAVEIDRRTGRCTILAGNSQLLPVVTVEASAEGDVGVIACNKAEFSLIVTETTPDRSAQLATGLTDDDIAGLVRRSDSDASPVGFWHYLDRDNDIRYTRLGGEYRLAIVADPQRSGAFNILYLDGAQTEASRWRKGMLKGRLTPTSFSNHYDLLWYDATMNAIDCEASATIEQNSILRLDFPLLKTSLRFAR